MEDAIDKSCRYDHRGKCTDNIEKLDWLSLDLKKQIEEAGEDIVKLEHLEECFAEAVEEASEENDFARVMRYMTARTHVKAIIEEQYRKYKPVGNDGKQK